MSSFDTASSEEVVIEDVDAPVSPNRRALEVGSFVFALAAVLFLAYNALYIFVVNKLQKAQGAEPMTFTKVITNFELLLTQQAYAMLVFALISVIAAGVVRGLYKNDERSNDRTIISATISIIVALFGLFVGIYAAVRALTSAESQLGDTKLARFTEFFTTLPGIVLAIGVLIIGAIFIFGRSDAAELETEDELSVDEPELTASNDEAPKL